MVIFFLVLYYFDKQHKKCTAKKSLFKCQCAISKCVIKFIQYVDACVLFVQRKRKTPTS